MSLISLIIRKIGGLVSKRGNRGRLNVLIYHRILPEPDPLRPEEVDCAIFARQLDSLQRYFNVLPLGEGVERLKNGSLPPRSVSITFDDGYADNVTEALPLLSSNKLSATFFIATGFLNGTVMWNDIIIEALRRTKQEVIDLKPIGLKVYSIKTLEQRKIVLNELITYYKYLPIKRRNYELNRLLDITATEIPNGLMMDEGQVRKLHKAGMDIGAHTVTHPILSMIDISEAKEQIQQSKITLEDIIGQPVNFFAYPNGQPIKDYTKEHVNIVKNCGFISACSTAWGCATNSSDFFQIPRFTPWDRTPERFALRLIKNNLHYKHEHV